MEVDYQETGSSLDSGEGTGPAGSSESLTDAGTQSIRGPREASLLQDETKVGVNEVIRSPVYQRMEKMSDLRDSLPHGERDRLSQATTVLRNGEGIRIDDQAGWQKTVWYVAGKE